MTDDNKFPEPKLNMQSPEAAIEQGSDPLTIRSCAKFHARSMTHYKRMKDTRGYIWHKAHKDAFLKLADDVESMLNDKV